MTERNAHSSSHDPSSQSGTVPLARPDLGAGEIEAVVEVLKSGWLAHGEYNTRFEEAFAEFLGVSHAITLNSGTSALELALKAHGIRGEVIAPSFTFVATANAILTAGATPVLCDVDRASRNVETGHIAERITPRTEAVMVVHYGGQPCAMGPIRELCDRRGLLLIEDSAETLGARWQGRQAGSFGIGCFSFFPTKNITTGEGGMMTCDDAAIDERARALAAHGISSTTFARERKERPWIRAADLPGHNFRMSNVLAAVGYRQLQRLPEMNARRQELAARYDKELPARVPGLTPPAATSGATHVYQMYTVTLPAERRQGVLTRLREAGIGASVHFDPPVHLQPAYLERGWKLGDLPETEKLASEIMTLPLFPGMTDAEQERVIAATARACTCGTSVRNGSAR